MKKWFLISLFIIFSNSVWGVEKNIGLKVGDSLPNTIITSIEGEKIDLNDKSKKHVFVFFRGSWCPYCMKQLKSIQEEIIPKLKTNQLLVGISVDRPTVAKKMVKKFNFTFPIVSDPKAKLLKKFKIANKLDDQMVRKYKSSYSIDVEGDSGEKHHLIAHPAVFIIQNGKILYRDIHIDYKERTKNNDILMHLK